MKIEIRKYKNQEDTKKKWKGVKITEDIMQTIKIISKLTGKQLQTVRELNKEADCTSYTRNQQSSYTTPTGQKLKWRNKSHLILQLLIPLKTKQNTVPRNELYKKFAGYDAN